MKVGDKVKILDKTCCCNINNCEYNIGDIDYIFKPYKDTFSLTKNPTYSFNPQDLELVKKEKVKVKYKKLRKINGVEIEKAQDGWECSEFKEGFIEYLKEFGYNQEPCFETLIDWANRRDKQFLIDKGFIEEIKGFKSFKLKLQINSKEELFALWHRLNMSNPIFDQTYDYNNSVPEGNSGWAVWTQVNDIYKQMKENGELK